MTPMVPIATDSLKVGWRTAFGDFPLWLSPAAAAPLLGISAETVRHHIRGGRVPSLPRGEMKGEGFRIPTKQLLDQLGIEATPFGGIETDGDDR